MLGLRSVRHGDEDEEGEEGEGTGVSAHEESDAVGGGVRVGIS